MELIDFFVNELLKLLDTKVKIFISRRVFFYNRISISWFMNMKIEIIDLTWVADQLKSGVAGEIGSNS